MLLFIIIVCAISIISSILIVSFILKRKKQRESQPETQYFNTEVNKNSSKSNGIGIWIFLILFGLLFESIGIFSIIFLQNKVQGWDEISAVITSADMTKYSRHKTIITVHVAYEYNGKKYEDKDLEYKSTTMREGQVLTILVNPENPEQFELELSRQFSLFYVFIAVGSIFILFSGYMCFIQLTGRKRKETGEATKEQEAEDENKRVKTPIIIQVIVVVLFGIFYFAMPLPLFLFMLCWFFGGFIIAKYRKYKKRKNGEEKD